MNKRVTAILMGLTLSAGTLMTTNADASEMNRNNWGDNNKTPYNQPLYFQGGQKNTHLNVQSFIPGQSAAANSTVNSMPSTTVVSDAAADSTTVSTNESNTSGYVWPLDDEFTIFDGFGYSSWRGGQHYGIDISSSTINGKAVHAVKAGTVEYAGWEDGGGGNTVIINHGNGVKSVYYHLSTITVTAGDKVSGGTQIGNVGSTGNSTGPHLHLEIRVNGTPVNPLNYVSAK